MSRTAFTAAAALLVASAFASGAEARTRYNCEILERFIDRIYDRYDPDARNQRGRSQRALLYVINLRYTKFCDAGGENPSPNRVEDFARWAGPDSGPSADRRAYVSWRDDWLEDRRR